MPDLRRVIHDVTRGIATGLTDSHLFDQVAVRLRENAPVKFWTELVKAMAWIVIGWRNSQKMAPDGHHLHRILDCPRKIEDMLKRSAVKHTRKLTFKTLGDGLIHVVYDGGPLIVGEVKRIDLVGS